MRLRPYQILGIRWLAARKRAYLGDGMRLGKTVMACLAVKTLSLRNTLVICPASACENWHREWAELGVPGKPAVCSFDILVRREDVRGADWDLVIIDEAHYCKSASAKRTKKALRIAAECPRSWLLSGTPMPNHAGELYTAVRYIFPQKLQALGITNAWEWFEMFCKWVPTLHGPKVYGIKNAPLLRATLEDVMLRRLITDVGSQLPPLDVHVSLLPRDEAFTDALREMGDERDLLALMEGEKGESGSVSRLRRYLGEYKAPFIAKEIIRELEDKAYSRIVIMAYHHSVLGTLRAAFAKAGIEWTGFDGGTPPSQRTKAIDAFQGGTVPVFISQQTASGVAIGLSASNEIVLVEPDWSPDNNAQAIMRIQKIGQSDPCRARYYAVAGTLDDAVMKTNARKTKMIVEGLPHHN